MFRQGMSTALGRVALGTACALAAVMIASSAGAPSQAWAGAPAAWPDDLSIPSPLGDLRQFIDSLQTLIAQVTEWVQLFRRSATDILRQMVWESPGLLPDEVDLTGLANQITRLPAVLRGVLEDLVNKLRALPASGSTAERHHVYIESSPALVHEATGIVETDEIVAGGAVRQAAASQATVAGAAAVARDLRPAAASVDARETSGALASAGQNLPSSRAGIELLIAGLGAGLRQQADLGAATADRLTILVYQMAQVSQQVEALGTTMGAWTLRQAERDRRALEGQLGLADTAAGLAEALQDTLVGVGDPPVDEPKMLPLY